MSKRSIMAKVGSIRLICEETEVQDRYIVTVGNATIICTISEPEAIKVYTRLVTGQSI